MYLIKVDEISKNTLYAPTTVDKLLTQSGISNHFVLTEDDVLQLYKFTELKNKKSISLIDYIEGLIPNIHEKL